MDEPILESARREIVSLHQFFCEWFGGRLAAHQFDQQFTPRFSPKLVFIPPAGNFLGLPELSASIRDAYGSNPTFRIEIRNVKVHQQMGSHVLCTYEEWQKNALASKPANNGRIATVLFKADTGLRWLHIHETWIPRALMDADPYDF